MDRSAVEAAMAASFAVTVPRQEPFRLVVTRKLYGLMAEGLRVDAQGQVNRCESP